MRRAKLALLLLGALTLGIAGGGFTDAAFTTHSENPGNTFTAASSFGCSQAPVTIQQASQSPKVVEDTWVDQNAPTVVQTDANPLNVSAQSGRVRRAFVKFTIPTTPAGCTITGASLRLNNVGVRTGRTIQVTRAASAWATTALTWNNQPGSIATDTPATAAAAAGLMSWNVTSMVAAGAANGFIVRDQTENQNVAQAFASSEATTASQRPQLVISYG